MPDSNRPGLGVDQQGNPVVDPTQNVLDLVAAAIQRQDDLREAADKHLREISELRAEYEKQLRVAESGRIDAIRAVDVAAVQRAAEVSMQQTVTLAAQVAASAETLRAQVVAADIAARVALAAALEPIQKDIADLRKDQYEARGVKANVVETTTQKNSNMGLLISLGVLAVMVVTLGVLLISKS